MLVGDGAKATCITKAQNGWRADCDCREAGTESNRQIESDRLWCKSFIELFISPKNTSIINQRQSQPCLLVREDNVGVAAGCEAEAGGMISNSCVFLKRVNVHFRQCCDAHV